MVVLTMRVVVYTRYKCFFKMLNVKFRNGPPKIEKQDTDGLRHHDNAMTSALVKTSSVFLHTLERTNGIFC